MADLIQTTQYELVMSYIAERLKTIRKGETFGRNGSVFDCTIDDVQWKLDERIKQKNYGCYGNLLQSRVEFGEQIGRYQFQTYDLNLEIDYKRDPNSPLTEYDVYYNRLPLWINNILADDSSEINDLWGNIYYKPGHKKFRTKWIIVRRQTGNYFRAVMCLKGLTIRQRVFQMFIEKE